MEIADLKKILKERHITYPQLSKMTGLSLSCITKIFGGYAQYPRIDTIKTIEHALGIDEPQTLSAEQQELFSLIQSLSDDEVKQLNDYLTFILSKRK